MDCFTKFEETACDCCSQKSVCTVHYQYGVPVLATCKGCDIKQFQQQADYQINRWLNGEF